jgi:hypothetical protein
MSEVLAYTFRCSSRVGSRLEKPARDKHSCLLQKFVNYKRKKFYNIGPSSKEIVHKSGPPPIEQLAPEFSALKLDHKLDTSPAGRKTSRSSPPTSSSPTASAVRFGFNLIKLFSLSPTVGQNKLERLLSGYFFKRVEFSRIRLKE